MRFPTLFLPVVVALAACGSPNELVTPPDMLEPDLAHPPTAAQLAQADSAAAYAQDLVDNSGYSGPLDATKIIAKARDIILAGDGSDATYYRALWEILLAVPQGHQALIGESCREPEMYTQTWSRFGVCGVASGDHVLVTYAEASNPLGLVAGDQVITAGTDSGPALLDVAWHRPVCGDYVPSAGGQREFTARSFFGTVPRGMTLGIVPGDGSAMRAVTIPAKDGHAISCADALGRSTNFNAKATVRADGVAVIQLPRFYPTNVAAPDPAHFQEFVDAFQATVQAEFDKVKSAPTIVWDARGNGGGITPVGLAIVAGMPGAKAVALSYCTQRNGGSSPPSFRDEHYAEYAITPGGPFAYSGKVAVIIDGLDYSAADYFAYAVARATSVPLVGGQTAGAFGGPGPMFDLTGTPTVHADIDVNRCMDAASNTPLEGKGTMPTVPVTYDVQDLRKGVDTVLEAAVARVK